MRAHPALSPNTCPARKRRTRPAKRAIPPPHRSSTHAFDSSRPLLRPPRLVHPERVDNYALPASIKFRIKGRFRPSCEHHGAWLEAVFMSDTQAVEGIRNIVLVHGGFVDGSGRQGVYD